MKLLFPAIWAVLWAVLPLSFGAKISQEYTSVVGADISQHKLNQSTNESTRTDLQLALLSRSSRNGRGELVTSSDELELDAAVSSKGFAVIGDAFSSVVDKATDVVGNAIKKAAVATANTIKKAGLTIGSAVANAAVVVGNHVVKAAVTKLASLPASIKNVANDIGRGVVQIGNKIADAGEIIADTTVRLAGDVLEHAQHGIQEGAKLSRKVGKFIADQAIAIGNEVAKVGPLVAGLAQAAWSEIKKFVDCFTESMTLCTIMIGSFCDCNAGSHVSPSTSGFSMRCVFSSSSDFAGGFGIRAVPAQSFNGKTASGTVLLPGDEYVQAYKTVAEVMRSRHALKNMKATAPTGSCETGLDVAFEGAAQFAPDISLSMNFNGDTEISIRGMVRASIDALIEGQGSCAFHAEKGIPKVPKTKVICAGYFCLAIMLQMKAQLDITGVLTGALEVSADVDFEIQGTVTVNPLGKAVSHFESPSIKHQDGFAIGASASSSVRVSMGPVLTVWPVPGIPINFHAMVNAEARAQGTLSFRSGMFLIQEDQQAASNSSSSTIDMCGAAALNTYADVDITSFALPPLFRAVMSTAFLMEHITAAIISGATAMTRMITGPLACIPGGNVVEDAIMTAAQEAASAISALIPDLRLDFSVKSIQIMAPTKLWCKEVYKTPGFDTAPCAAELGCKFAGRSPPRGVELTPPDQVTNHPHPTGVAAACHDIPMGDRFIQLGNFRLADIDGNHFSVSHKGGVTAQIFRNDGTLHPGPRTDFGAWGRSIGPSKGIHFGFQYIQIGNFRLGAVDDMHFSISHVGGSTAQIYRGDGNLFPGPRGDYSTFDRPEGIPTGVSFGDRFVQFGKFRVGEADGNHFVVTHISGQLIQLYRSDGTRHPGAPAHYAHLVTGRGPGAWTCKDIAEMAFGACDPDFGAWGDRFIQLGSWRLAAIDSTHFSVSHKGGKTAQIYRSDGTLHPGPRTSFNAWSRPIGFPHGITFGLGFIQIGNFRLGAVDDTHLSISYIDGTTIQIFRSDATRHPGPRPDFGMWDQSAGPAGGVTFGDRFLQLGMFRIGDHDGGHFVVTHKSGSVMQLFRSDGTLHNVGGHWSHAVNSRYSQFHCGGIQDIMNSCPGITAGDDFLQLGDWRVAAMDGNHFTVSHRGGQTAQIYRSDGTRHPGPRTDWNSWRRETRQPSSPSRSIVLGDRFIQFGSWRMGEWDGNHFSISHVHGQTAMIFRSDGTLHPGPRTDHNLWTLGRSADGPQGISFGDRFVQIGSFRVGDVDSTHFSISHVGGLTAQIFRSDGTRHGGPRSDWTTFGRQLLDCGVQ